METLIIVSGIILAVAVGVYYALRQQAKAHLEITEQFDKIQSRLGTEYTSINPDFVYIIQEAARQQATALEMQNQVSNLAFPMVPHVIPLGPAYRFVLNHIVELDSPMELFDLRYETV